MVAKFETLILNGLLILISLYFRCCKLSGDSKTEAILTASLLLPPLHSASLTCLVRFLSDVAEASAENKMDARSLAIVFTPSLFPVTEEATNIKKVEVTNADLAQKLDIVETLIRNSNSVRFCSIGWVDGKSQYVECK